MATSGTFGRRGTSPLEVVRAPRLALTLQGTGRRLSQVRREAELRYREWEVGRRLQVDEASGEQSGPSHPQKAEERRLP